MKSNKETLQDRLLQVADVTSALMQKRSYKSALDKDVVIGILKNDADAGKLDADIISVLAQDYDNIQTYVWEQAKDTFARYDNMKNDYDRYLKEFTQSEYESIEEMNLLPSMEFNYEVKS